MKKIIVALVLAVVLFSAAACSSDSEKKAEEKVKPVKVFEASEQINKKFLEYVGVVKSGEVKKFSFKSPGKILKIYVHKGRQIKKGEILAKLDSEEMEYAIKASKAQLDAAEAGFNMASDAYDFAKSSYDKTKELFEKNAVSENTYDEAKLGMDVKESELNRAKEIRKQAEIDYQHKNSMVQNTRITSNIDGYVIDVLYREGEMVAAGYPVIVIRNDKQIISVGLSQKDTDRVNLGTEAIINVNGVQTTGQITNISDIPDNVTRTYDVEIALDDNKYKIGYVAKVEVIIGEEAGIWIPIASVLSDGDDYVYLVTEDIVVKRKIIPGDIKGSMVKVHEGLKSGDRVVVEGFKRLNDRDRVIVQR